MKIDDLKRIKQDLRKNPVLYKLLSTIIGECEQISKDPSDSQITGVLQKLYKDNEATLKECGDTRFDVKAQLMEENSFIKPFLPKMLTEGELIGIINSQIQLGNNMSTIMKYLSSTYRGRFDGKQAIEILKTLL